MRVFITFTSPEGHTHNIRKFFFFQSSHSIRFKEICKKRRRRMFRSMVNLGLPSRQRSRRRSTHVLCVYMVVAAPAVKRFSRHPVVSRT